MPKNPRLSQDANGKWIRQKMPKAPKWDITYPGQSTAMTVRAEGRRDAAREASHKILKREGLGVFPLAVSVSKVNKTAVYTFNCIAITGPVEFRVRKV